MKKNELEKGLEKLRKVLKDSILTEGEESMLRDKIKNLEQDISSVDLKENALKLQRIIDNNNKTSRNTLILSFLMILLSIFTIYKSYMKREIDYTPKINTMIEINTEFTKRINGLEEILWKIENNTSYIIKIDSTIVNKNK